MVGVFAEIFVPSAYLFLKVVQEYFADRTGVEYS